VTPAGIADLKRDEGFRARPYRCTAGKLSIGYGRNLDDHGISEAEAGILLVNDVAAAEADLSRLLPWWMSLDQVRRDAIGNMAFNLGSPRLMQFKSMLAAARAGNWDRAAAEAGDSKWADVVGARAVRIQHMLRTGTRP
jgi:lysozyme